MLDFGIGDVKEEGSHMTGATQYRSAALSLGGLDPYWRSQLLVEYSKDLLTCRILDDQFSDGIYTVRDGVIFYWDIIFLARASKLKDKLLHAAYDIMISNPTGFIRAYHTILEGFMWETSKRRCTII